eukprot:1184044-Prorocentrum_minimum.AAC.1
MGERIYPGERTYLRGGRLPAHARGLRARACAVYFRREVQVGSVRAGVGVAGAGVHGAVRVVVLVLPAFIVGVQPELSRVRAQVAHARRAPLVVPADSQSRRRRGAYSQRGQPIASAQGGIFSAWTANRVGAGGHILSADQSRRTTTRNDSKRKRWSEY